MRITISSSIAACLIAAIGLLWFTRIERTANAAEQLQEAVQATSAYKGWIHQTASSANLTPPPGAPALPERATYHTNTSDGTRADVREYADGLEITMYFPEKHETASYSGKTHEIRLGTLHDETARSFQRYPTPATIGEMLALGKQLSGRDPASVKETPEGDLTRYDITMFASDAEAEAFRKEHDSGFTGRGMVIWVNRDKLMTRMKFEDPQVR